MEEEQQQQQTRRLPTSTIAALVAALLVGGGGAAWLLSNNKTAPTTNNQISTTISPTQTPVQIPVTPPPSAIKPTETPKPAQTVAQESAKVYWLKDSGTSTELVPVPVSTTKSEKPGDSLQTAFNTLLTAPPTGTFSSIPQGTKLNSVSVKNDGIHVDLSSEFKSGGGSATMIARLAQVLYTATSSEPNAQVWLFVDGKPLEVLGGEGLVVPVPLTRQTFEKDFSL
ncbi:MAG TPA: GerMN domain-containing protein [Halomicronema sp.]